MTNDNLVTQMDVTDDDGNVIGQRQVVTYAGLLNQAHKDGLKRIEATITQVPTPENGMMALATAKVFMEHSVFVESGDASPDNVSGRAAPHFIRVALTRAKARALRDAVNIGVISIEELADDIAGDTQPHDRGNGKPQDSKDTVKPMSDAHPTVHVVSGCRARSPNTTFPPTSP